MRSLLQDLRFAFRQMARTPGFSLTAILSLALGIGATVSVFSVIYSAVLNAWPYAGFDRVCQINTINKTGNEGAPSLTGPQVRQLRQARAVEDIIGLKRWNLVITGSDVPEDGGRLHDGKRVQFFGMPASRAIFPALGCTRHAGSSTGSGPELHFLAAAFQQRSQYRRQEHRDGAQELHHPGGYAVPFYLGGRRCLSSSENVAGPDGFYCRGFD